MVSGKAVARKVTARRAAFVVAVFLGQLVRGRDEQLRMVRLEDGLGARLMVGPGIAVEKQDRAGLDPPLFEHLAERLDLAFVKLALDLAVGENTLLDLEAQRPLDQRHMFAEVA